ncbi:hypothetical protein HK101_008787 [Irineochytrium annulatum]|nr:hypothetical protein HK101_008787 [Irineochytrium annulatum]
MSTSQQQQQASDVPTSQKINPTTSASSTPTLQASSPSLAPTTSQQQQPPVDVNAILSAVVAAVEQPQVAEAAAPSPSTTPAKRKVTRCAFGCGSAAVKSVGTCRYCTAQFCSKHRLPESHACSNLSSCVTEARDNLAKRLISEKTVAQKVATA